MFNQYLHEYFPNSIFFIPISVYELIQISKSLKNSNACGYDNLSNSLLKQVIYYIVDPLVHIFSISLKSGIVPDKLKIAKITPVYIIKKNDPHTFNNYRPISVLPSISKLLEKCIYSRLYSFCLKNNILIDSQYGFRKKHSTSHALIELQDKVLSAINNNKIAIGVFMDLSKAFDIVNHEILLSKLQY